MCGLSNHCEPSASPVPALCPEAWLSQFHCVVFAGDFLRRLIKGLLLPEGTSSGSWGLSAALVAAACLVE
jgi:hypothetical protein